jgi:tRNA threonylcarbamoyl adenosine modification protein (Sua5/YciO/YrdC/YwlC family)
MSQLIQMHPVTPQQNKVFSLVDALRSGSIALLPTDTNLALACEYTNKKGLERIRSVKELDKDHHFTLICDSLSGISRFAQLSDPNFRLIKRLIPGPFTFILPATREVPKLLTHAKRNTIGFRVPNHPITMSIVKELGSPLLATTASLPDDVKDRLEFKQEIIAWFERQVDIVVDDELELSHKHSTVIDLTGNEPLILREGELLDTVLEVIDRYDISL